MQTDKQISILGCGWLGLPLALNLKQKNFKVKGSTTSPAKLKVLAENGISPYLIDLAKNNTESLISFLETDLLIICFPPKIRAGKGTEYLSQIKCLQQAISKASIKFILFISSTSVYPDLNTSITEDTDLTENFLQNYLLQAEQEIQKTQIPTTILRFAGLIGPNRHPGRFFAGKINVPNPLGPVNLIHLEDCIQIIAAIINQDKWNEVYNASSDEHPTRQEFYTSATVALNLPLPHFATPTSKDIFKIISSEKLKKDLQYRFIYPNPMLFKEVLPKNKEF